MTDPVKINLDAIKEYTAKSPDLSNTSVQVFYCGAIAALITEVETLRERGEKLVGWLNEQESMLANTRSRIDITRREFEADEAREAELAKALAGVMVNMPTCDSRAMPDEWVAAAAVLAAMPTEAMKRARARDDALKVTRTHLEKISQLQQAKCEDASAEMLFMVLDNKVAIALIALDKLDALNQPAKTEDKKE